MVKALIKISGIQSRLFESTVILLRRTTWKCGKVERVVINFLQKQAQQFGQTKSHVKDILEHATGARILIAKLMLVLMSVMIVGKKRCVNNHERQQL